MKANRSSSVEAGQRKKTWSPLTKKQNNYFKNQIKQKFNDITKSFLSSHTSTGRAKTALSISSYNNLKEEQFKIPNTKKSYSSHLKNNHLFDKFAQEDYFISVPLKSVPRPSERKTSFGWINQHANQPKQQININKVGRSYSIVLKRQKCDWVETLKELRKEFQSISGKLTILPPQMWSYLLKKFEYFYLNLNEKQQLLELFCKFLQWNFDTSKQIISHFIGAYFGIVNKKSQFQFCDQVGTRFHKMQNRTYFKHKYCLQYAKFMISPNLHRQKFYSIHFTEFKFDHNEKEVFELFTIVRQFCQNNMDAFAFITLYFQISVKKSLKTLSFKKVEEQFVKILEQVSKKYPPSLDGIFEDNIIFGLQNISTVHKFERLFFYQGKSHYEQLKQFVVKKAEQAKQEQTLFRCLVEDICFKYGYSFKSGVKIKSSQHQACIFRTIEKLMTKNKFKKDFAKLKKSTSQTDSQNKNISERIQSEIQQAQKVISQILEKQTFIEFDAKDLVRGKCTFSKVQQILQTVNLLQSHIQAQGFKIIEVKNRLKKGTKDVSLIIKLTNSIAELQLALKLDSVSNEFNHKIFELTRSQIHSPIINLFIHSERWCETFFTDQFELFEQIINFNRQPVLRDSVTFKQLKRDIVLFKKDFLDANEIKYVKSFKTKQEQKQKVVEKMKEIKRYSTLLKPKNIKPSSLQISQRQNLINFYKSFDYKMALQTIQNIDLIDESVINNSSRLLKLKADILKIHEKYKGALQCYENYLKFYSQQKKNSFQLAECFHNIGSIHDVQQNFSQAIEYYQKSLQIKQNIIGQKSIEIAASLNGIGQVFSNMKNKDAYSQALQYHMKALEIRRQILGKQSMDAATSLNNIGVVYRRQGNHEKAFDYLKQSFEIRQKTVGKQSLDAATSLYNIGVLFHCKEEHKKALEYLGKSIEIIEKIMGKESLDLARGHLYVSYVLEKLDELQRAQDSISLAYGIFKKVLGEGHVKTHLSYEQYSDIKTKIQRNLKLSFTGFKIYKKRSSLDSVGSMQNWKLQI